MERKIFGSSYAELLQSAIGSNARLEVLYIGLEMHMSL